MDDTLLLDAVERYRNGEMSAQEITFFEELRKNNPEIDQLAAEHNFFLGELEKMSDLKAYRHNLNEVENKLTNEGIISRKEAKGKAKIIYLWNKYRRTIAVAASIAGIVSISTATIVSIYSENKKVAVITPLVDTRLNQFEHKLTQIESKLKDASSVQTKTPVKPDFEANFRATAFLVDGNGYLVTNAHVVDNARNIIVENKKGDQYFAKAIYSNKLTDLAILKISDTSFKRVIGLPYTFPKYSAELGEHIFTLGYPREEVVYGEGYLSAKSGYYGDTTSYQISISVNPGNSGGPVVNKNGEIIGIISSKEANADGVVFAIKSKNIYNAIKASGNDSIKLPSVNSLRGLERVQQIKKLEDFVYMIKGN
ncbi:trypsin-like peptidase domain-containing protein [Ginsengibacter hankyongi]|uniref:Trypsin-like peptidase domain-containing protein n=1 Tax=Ginsengibacter hankyongi TaxID=2607284 RepID=A0A5J5IDE4_9BACT|nr:serine protease [Ginsengibacter hankyongi]KAA9037642.1 trypsin-like peptidase domain-containing protein [Ginsengibacter hankyongi]